MKVFLFFINLNLRLTSQHYKDHECLILPRTLWYLHFHPVAAFQIITFGKAEDMLIKSDNYPDRYPPGANVSWTWNHSGGNWGVVFLDFDLDLGMDGYGDGDLLQMSDGWEWADKILNKTLTHTHTQVSSDYRI